MMVSDPNMDTALDWANQLGSPPALPSSLIDVNQRAKLVDHIDAPLINNSLLYTLSNEEKGRRIDSIAALSKDYMPDVGNDNERANITLRLWSGCLSAAKTIALETRSGPNTPQSRSTDFSSKIDVIAQRDRIYCAGVEAAPSFKRLRKEEYSFEGVPENSPVRRYP